RFAGVDPGCVAALRLLERNRAPVGFMTTLDLRTVSDALKWNTGVFATPRVAVVGSDRTLCGSLLFFDSKTRRLNAIEGFVYGEAWPEDEAPLFWSETERAVGRLGRQ